MVEKQRILHYFNLGTGQASRFSQSGQGLTEYLLLLVVTVALVLALASAYFRPMNQFLQNYVGEYIECLIDYGELPGLGYSESEVEQECNRSFEAFSLARGRPRTPGESSSSRRDLAGRGTGAERADGASRSGSRVTNLNSSGGSGRTAGVDSVSIQGKQREIPVENLDETSYLQVRRTSSSSGSGGGVGGARTIQAEGFAGVLAAEREKAKRRGQRFRTVASAGDSPSPAAKKFVVTPPKPKEASAQQGIDLGLGGIFRLALILAIIVAIIFFIAGQALQITKSMEK
jgi:hypothetical protein